MEEQNLQELLQQLHHDLEQTDAVDEQTEKMLQDVMADIQQLLQSPDAESTEHPHTLADRMNDIMYRLDESYHPLVVLIGQITNSLSNMGI